LKRHSLEVCDQLPIVTVLLPVLENELNCPLSAIFDLGIFWSRSFNRLHWRTLVSFMLNSLPAAMSLCRWDNLVSLEGWTSVLILPIFWERKFEGMTMLNWIDVGLDDDFLNEKLRP
jgi:hypothetical protein